MEFKMTKYRDAGTGRYVTKEFAKKHPGTTVGENSKPKSQRKPKNNHH
ncbi:TPA: multidrug transporter [Legionella pneumophila]|nr:multidrug transporter [Legionella pneumophila]HAT1770853.1 multidrug transporter [Legionella pneumophila]HAT1797978.1 multidrug transporter [Legionella pneumophila]HAT1845966.1 multidrug transporter [Legionella pneumophila]HAT1861827.1 multidrug transporter [Legionella pneumophila]